MCVQRTALAGGGGAGLHLLLHGDPQAATAGCGGQSPHRQKLLQCGLAMPHLAFAPRCACSPCLPPCPCPQEVLDMLRALSPAAFVTLLTNFYRGLKGKFKVPIFAHQELDL